MGLFTCKDCPNRHYECHSKCEKYLREKEEHERLKAKDDARRHVDQYVAGAITRKQNNAAIRRKRTSGYGKHYTN